MSQEISPLPSDAILVHIGPYKTGTTAIQSTLAASRDLLRQHGVYYPAAHVAHHRPVRSLRQYREGWANDGVTPPDPQVWARFAADVAATPGRVVISSEFLSEAEPEARAQLVRDLGADRVHLVGAARSPAALAVSTWQQVVRTYGRSISLEDWLDRTFRRDDPLEGVDAEGRPVATSNRFWQRVDPSALVSRWADVVPADRFTLVVLAEGDRRLLPTTFERLLDLPEGLLADQHVPQSNRGLTAVETALIRRVNAGLESRVSWDDYSRTMRGGVIRRLQEVWQPRPDDAKDRLPDWAVEQAEAEAERAIARVRTTGVRIIGDPASMLAAPPQEGAEVPAPTEVPIDLAAEAVIGAIAVATRGRWSFDLEPRRRPRKSQPNRPRRKKPTKATQARPGAGKQTAGSRPRRVDQIPTRELAGLLAGRVTGAGRRWAKRLVSR